jgi:hypothetical protein
LDEWSTGKTLRFDYFHSGTAKEEHFSLDEVRREGDWAGTRKKLIDSLRLGEYLFEVLDPKSEQPLYSRGFDSIFGEWQTTAEASAGTWRTFHESQRFPEPDREVRLILKRRNEGGPYRMLYSSLFHPKDANRSPLAPVAQPWTVFQHGEPAEKLDLLVLGDGYTAAERPKFEASVRRLASILFDTEPFKSRKESFNVWGLQPDARESGIADPRRGQWRDSPLGFRSNAFGIDRYALSYTNRAIREVAALCPYDAMIVVCNTSKHAGGGIYNLWANAPADSPTAAYVFVHELGHSLAGLADEYYSAEVAYQYPDGEPVEPERPNVTAVRDRDKLKWRDLVEPDTPIPTPWDQKKYDAVSGARQTGLRKLESHQAKSEEIQRVYSDLKTNTKKLLAEEPFAGKTGAFEGAHYRAKGLFRPEVDCLMFSQNRNQFCRVCVRAIECAIDSHLP